ncbi:MAG: hypothetical protein HZA48_10375 [Planctomycetes bacterium]|nr:hypothetical protein [Planctomycetota bacterium]
MDKFLKSFYIASGIVLLLGVAVSFAAGRWSVGGSWPLISGYLVGFMCCFLPIPTFHTVVHLLNKYGKTVRYLLISAIILCQFSIYGVTFFLIISKEVVNLFALWAGASAIVVIIAIGMLIYKKTMLSARRPS